MNPLHRISHVVARRSFRLLERVLGLHVVPAHYYSPIPQAADLSPAVFDSAFDSDGLDWNCDGQNAFLADICSKYAGEFSPVENTGISLVDAFVLHAMIRERKPRLMIEVGSGTTTEISLNALRKNRNEGAPFQFVAIEPYPRPSLRAIRDPDFRLVPEKVQSVGMDLLREADLLFIDSSHVSKVGSDVNFEILSVVPKLKQGALVHWHDIVMPCNYWRDWMENGNMFWNESYLLHAFLLFNQTFKIRWASRFLDLTARERLMESFPYYRQEHRITSLWVERMQ